MDGLLNPDHLADLDKAKNSMTKDYRQSIERLDIHTAYEQLFELMWYSQLPCFDVETTSNAPDTRLVEKKTVN